MHGESASHTVLSPADYGGARGGGAPLGGARELGVLAAHYRDNRGADKPGRFIPGGP
jgi:hypothetical protein